MSDVAVLAALVIAALSLLFPVTTIVECSTGCEVVGRRSAAGVEVPRAFTYAGNSIGPPVRALG